VDAAPRLDDLLAAGVRTIVLGIGSEVAPRPAGTGTLEDSTEAAVTCLSELARRGGTARVDGPPHYYVATQPEALERNLREIFGGTVPRPCSYVLSDMPADRNQVQVLFDGKQIPRSRRDGWDFDPPTTASASHLRRGLPAPGSLSGQPGRGKIRLPTVRGTPDL
jgi:hypothetical protein